MGVCHPLPEEIGEGGGMLATPRRNRGGLGVCHPLPEEVGRVGVMPFTPRRSREGGGYAIHSQKK